MKGLIIFNLINILNSQVANNCVARCTPDQPGCIGSCILENRNANMPPINHNNPHGPNPSFNQISNNSNDQLPKDSQIPGTIVSPNQNSNSQNFQAQNQRSAPTPSLQQLANLWNVMYQNNLPLPTYFPESIRNQDSLTNSDSQNFVSTSSSNLESIVTTATTASNDASSIRSDFSSSKNKNRLTTKSSKSSSTEDVEESDSAKVHPSIYVLSLSLFAFYFTENI